MGSNRLDDVEVRVLVDGTWYPGWLDPTEWRRHAGDRWEGYVRWSQGPGLNYLRHFDQDDIRQV